MNDTISPQDLQRLLTSAEDFVLIDIRRETDFEAEPSIIRGALRRLPESIDLWAPQLPPTAQIVVYCVRGGSVSQSVVPALRKRGLAAKYLLGGITAWRSLFGTDGLVNAEQRRAGNDDS